MKFHVTILFLILTVVFAFNAYADQANTDRVKAIFQANCTACHGGPKPQLFDLLNVKELVEKNVVQGKDGSKLYQAITRIERWMPLGKDPLELADKQSILSWLTDGYPSFDGTIIDPPPATDAILGDNEISRCIRNYLFSKNQVLARDYFPVQLANYYGTSKLNLDRLAEAVTKLFNIVSVAEVDEDSKGQFVACGKDPKAILMLNLRSLNQSRERADDIIRVGEYPYFIDRTGIEGFEEAVANQIDIIRILRTKTVPYIRADWLVDTASRDPVYSNLLFKDVVVNNIDDFERKFLGVDTFKQLFLTEEAKVAIFRRSGVTLFNRELHEYNLDLRMYQGATYRSTYWKTFDVVNDKDQRNLFAFPFGPFYDFYQLASVKFLQNRAFINDATEILFMTPGGLASALFAGPGQNNKRIFEAQTEVATHAANSIHPVLGSGRLGFTGKSGAILNGVSCLACHSGMNAFVDEGKNHINLSTDFSNEQVNFQNRISYHDQLDIDTHVKATNAAYAVAQKAIGAKQVSYVDTQEPVFATAKSYNEDVGVCQFGLEHNFTCDGIKYALGHAPDLARKLGLSETGKGKASRLNIELLEPQIAVDLNLGRTVLFKKGEPPPIIPPPPVCYVTIYNGTQYAQELKEVVFGDKKYPHTYLNVGQTQKYDEHGDGRLDACLYYKGNTCVVTNKLFLKKCTNYQILVGANGYAYLNEK